MLICVVGGDGRAHALDDVLGRHHEVVVTPGNPGIPDSVADPPEAIDADLFVISPEAPLVDGLADRLRAQGKVVYGPGADGARLEGSKSWMKEVVAAAEVPTARFGSFDDADEAIEFMKQLPPPYVVKTDGLAAGKGVLVTHDLDAAERDVRSKLSGESFGGAGSTVVVEEGMTGPELSVLAVCDGQRAVALEPAQDFKRIFDGDEGPNTGGMGAYSPVPIADASVVDEVMDRFVGPTLFELRQRGIDYRGTLYAGLMLTPDGPRLVEYNVRFGDPEAQVVLPRLTSDLGELLHGAAAGELGAPPTFSDDAVVTLSCATEGYPESSRSGDVIEGLEEVRAIEGVTLYFAGVAADEQGRLLTNGGRVLTLTARGPNIAAARELAYRAVERLDWPGMQFRRDIAARAAEEERNRT